MSVIHAPKESELDGRHLLFPVAMLLFFVILLLRLWYLQVVTGPELTEKAAQYQAVSVEKLAPRGLIVDRNGRLIAGVHSELVIMAVPQVVDKHPWVLERLAVILRVPLEKLKD